MKIRVIGAGLAGCEAAWQAAECGADVDLYEMKPLRFSPAHSRDGFAELVCSNSLKAERTESAAGLLKEEMRRLGSLLLPCADSCRVPAGGALAVDRDAFSSAVTAKIDSHPLICVHREEVTEIPRDGVTVIATGPLTSDALAEKISRLCGGSLSFYDAAAPIVTAESLNMERIFSASRYGRGDDGAYLNCPMDREEYERFYEALTAAERAPIHGFDTAGRVYEGCMPVEIMAKRGKDTLRFGPMKPVGLRDPRTGHRPWAVLQLRREDARGAMYNLVGFQTNLKFGEQKRVFGMIPGLEHAEYVRCGVMHRNTFLNSPLVLSPDFSLKQNPDLFFAGQITGVEGYMESAASGIVAGINAVRRLKGKETAVLPETTMTGSLSRYVGTGGKGPFQPMGANFGILPPLEQPVRGKRERYAALAARALDDLENFIPSVRQN
ncbi:MAG: methylenetetrahydrofolate--tRNA-(uracil(54)-C(5))-methyltransferase (FADH(2)-oxidizing) TrmFO [Oscillospiraceae bacterium]|jgi:methylenetetrahydrofolate--tRNA-(uracil-5-)-methyltransferase|nr:methylenetetrahydrofolate--tRNA-(uracil(54)-C(5))-methyltransferase (FADH(2)-oxidizing) TrmFO [Oscillospiraceae bacterium]MCI2035245.1 methylenetetrahydrofolate--tRNA-(uracil(54)-C(5))-methyltransferase (FADH(2)-oxidizing) TrmFO [Oscillospiraceae bacterium]